MITFDRKKNMTDGIKEKKQNKTRLDFRVSVESKAIIEQAASLSGQTVSDFAVSTLIKSAQEVISQNRQTKLSLRDQELFLQMLESEDEPNTALENALKTYKKKVSP
ncbi:MAG: DUF1778 domain-containing protein [Acidobacteriota bacterium]|nr:DUF1778 domain-containing protein [Acidobacteriota bacterium]